MDTEPTRSPLPIIEHSEMAVGRKWTPEDHAYLVRTIRKIEALAEEIVRRNSNGICDPRTA
jgi:hypothetical protein